MPQAYIIYRRWISYRRYITRSERNGYHWKKSPLSVDKSDFFRGYKRIFWYGLHWVAKSCIFDFGLHWVQPFFFMQPTALGTHKGNQIVPLFLADFQHIFHPIKETLIKINNEIHFGIILCRSVGIVCCDLFFVEVFRIKKLVSSGSSFVTSS